MGRLPLWPEVVFNSESSGRESDCNQPPYKENGDY